jgi:hypothetical protein
VDFLKKKEGEEFLVSNVFNIPVVNILWNMVASKRFSLTDPRYISKMLFLTVKVQHPCCEHPLEHGGQQDAQPQ